MTTATNEFQSLTELSMKMEVEDINTLEYLAEQMEDGTVSNSPEIVFVAVEEIDKMAIKEQRKSTVRKPRRGGFEKSIRFRNTDEIEQPRTIDYVASVNSEIRMAEVPATNNGNFEEPIQVLPASRSTQYSPIDLPDGKEVLENNATNQMKRDEAEIVFVKPEPTIVETTLSSLESFVQPKASVPTNIFSVTQGTSADYEQETPVETETTEMVGTESAASQGIQFQKTQQPTPSDFNSRANRMELDRFVLGNTEIKSEDFSPGTEEEYSEFIPRHRSEPQLVKELLEAYGTDSYTHEQYEKICGKILEKSDKVASNCVMFVASTTTQEVVDSALSIALLMGQSESKVLVVDANETHQTLTSKLAATKNDGLMEVINHERTWEESVVALNENIHILPWGKGSVSRPKTASSRLNQLTDSLKSQYDFVVIEAGSALDMIPKTWGVYADSTYLFVSLSDSDAEQADNAISELRNSGARLLGCIVTNQ